ncbi:transcriptional regulator PtsJ [Massilia sp. CFBP9012]|uniref:MocR-like B6 salvage transcription factor PtsJ n=1 Tax=Massilia sp. CFBP9012 TaxID=3096531 RepID=UPI002A6A0ECF|nr:transcriptional regulator PtsJ [Massilia sp. CFBP9012]MDY0976188.1 transcriptional regulator PtsJ [Massilia sp. CFBP9012]
MKLHGKTAAEIVDCVRTLVQSGQLASGDSLPPVRDLADELGINRNTVASAYRRLVTSGIAVTQGRLGTTIRNQYAQGEQEGAMPDTPLEDLASGNPNPAWLPDLAQTLLAARRPPRLYGEPTVNAALESHIRAWCAPDCPPGFEVDLAHGAVDAIERLLSLDLLAGDKVAVENPCFLSGINTLRNLGLQPIGVGVDGEGMLVAELESALDKGAQAVILTPRAHNPTGCSLSDKRARAIARVLARYPHVLVIVDDHFALLSNADYHSVIPRGAGRWALIRSFAKALGPDIRVAAVASDPATSRQLRQRLAVGTAWVSHLLQDMVELTLASPDGARLIGQARQDYTRRRRDLEAALREQEIGYVADGDGLNLWIPLAVDDRGVALALARQGWLVRHGEGFSVDQEVKGVRITISTIEPEQCRRLALAIRRSLG